RRPTHRWQLSAPSHTTLSVPVESESRADRRELTMTRHRLTVVLSQAQGKNPAKRALEESIAAALLMEPGLEVSIVPYLYDLGPDHTGRLFLESVSGDMAVLAWMYPRAAFWLLDRCGIKGHQGESKIAPPADEEEDEGEAPAEPEPSKGIGATNVPERPIWCLDLRDHADHAVYVDEVKRIAAECRQQHEAKQAKGNGALLQLGLPGAAPDKPAAFAPEQLLAQPG